MKIGQYETHPAADIFPLLDGEQYAALVADIKAHGQRDPITLYDGLVLDGRNRLRACTDLGWVVKTREYTGSDPIALVVSCNLQRRHLSESQRGMCAGRLADMKQGARTDIAQICAKSQEEAADMLNVSRRTVQAARSVLARGAPSLVAAVESGKASVSAAAEVATLPEPEQAEVVARGEREILARAKEIRNARLENRREERTQKIADICRGETPLESLSVRAPLIYADPPWRYEHVETESRAIENQYPTMSLDEIKALPVASKAADDAVLFMWATSPKLAEAMGVLEAWGFNYRTSMVWVKDKIGMGYYARQRHELLLIATKGSPPTPAPSARPDSVIEADRTEHSAKPDQFYGIIETMYPAWKGLWLELFQRRARDGWVGWGNQAGTADA